MENEGKRNNVVLQGLKIDTEDAVNLEMSWINS